MVPRSLSHTTGRDRDFPLLSPSITLDLSLLTKFFGRATLGTWKHLLCLSDAVSTSFPYRPLSLRDWTEKREGDFRTGPRSSRFGLSFCISFLRVTTSDVAEGPHPSSTPPRLSSPGYVRSATPSVGRALLGDLLRWWKNYRRYVFGALTWS